MFRLPFDPGRRLEARFSEQREEMVEQQLVRRGITDGRVLQAFRSVPRHEFVPRHLRRYAYEDSALPIAGEQSISQPYVIALTLQALRLTGAERVLEVGTGSGYAAALLSHLAKEVFSIERLRPLALAASERLRVYGVEVAHGDGTLGWPAAAPFDAIAVAASGPRIPTALLEQLTPTGRIVIPVREALGEALLCVAPEANGTVSTSRLETVRFVPLIGAQGVPVEGAAAEVGRH